MSKRWIGVIASVALAALGAFMLVRYVNSAEARALEGTETVEVLVVTGAVEKGTPAETLAANVETRLVPANVQAAGSVASLDDLGGTVAAVDLLPGEQVLTTRFVTAQQLEEEDGFEVPDGLLEVTVLLEPERALGGELRPGAKVAFIASFDPFTLDTTEPSLPDPNEEDEDGGDAPKTPNTTHLVVPGVWVTNVQLEELPPETTEEFERSGGELAPTGNLFVTLGVEPADAERIVFTAEFGNVWLALENGDIDTSGTQIQTRNTIHLPRDTGAR
jgi:pilus assembly protein CpaB